MAKRSTSPIMTWIFWGIVVLGVFLMVTWEYFVAGFSADSSKITYLIVFFFIYGFIASLLVALHLQSEFKSLMAMDANQRIGDPNSSDIAAMFDSAMERLRRGDRIEVRNLVSAYGAKIKSRVDNIGVISGMLITVGLLGTVVGLIITVSGLGAVLNANGSDYAAMKAGLNQTVSGMGTAFYTTFFGALLGGVVLKVLGAEMKKSATQLVADALHFSELFVAPQFSRASSEALISLEARVVVLDDQLNKLGDSLSAVIDLIDSKQQGLASGLGDLLATVEQTIAETNQRADARIAALEASVEQTAADSTAKADERIGALIALVGQAMEQSSRLADERLGAIVAVVESSVGETNRQANERLEAVVAISTGTIGEANRQADERLTALVGTIDKTTEQTHRLADERLKAILEIVDKASGSIHRETDERLSKLVETAGQSIEHSRRQAEERLGTKASDLSRKLSEAAAVLAALVTPSETPRPEE